MTDFSLIDLGKLSEPATELIKRISDGIGGALRPAQIKRIAKAEGEADKIRTLAKIQASDIERRAMQRVLYEETQKQANIEAITARALPMVKETALPSAIDEDWLSNFFEKSRIFSSEEMQTVWAKILAGEANQPGIFSKRTINLVAALDRNEALLFSKLCSFAWTGLGLSLTPLIFDKNADIYNKHGLDFASLKHLDTIGLVSFEPLAGFKKKGFGKQLIMTYQNRSLLVEFSKDANNELDVGIVLLTAAGEQLAAVCALEQVEGCYEYVKGELLKKQELKISEIMQAS